MPCGQGRSYVKLRRVGFEFASVAALLVAAGLVRGAEPQPAATRADSGSGDQEIDFGRRCASGPIDPAITPTVQGKGEHPRQDPQHPFAKPEYPPIARRAGAEGTVVLFLLVNEEGRIARARVDRSSGFEVLDQSALRASRDWTALPAIADGKTVCAWGRFAITFRLTGDDRPDLANVKIHPNAGRLLELMAHFHLDEDLADLSGAAGGSRDVGNLTAEVMHSTEVRAELDAALHDTLAIISLRMSEQEIAEAVRFLESPAGSKMMDVQLAAAREMAAGVLPALSRTGCEIMQLRRSLDDQAQRRDLALPGLPVEFKRALPRLLDESASYCSCAVRQRSWLPDVRSGKDPQAAVNGACGSPPELKW